jgi:hypothetical protein
MNHEPACDRSDAIRQIAEILSTAYLRLRFPDPQPAPVDCAEKKSESWK